MILSDEEIALRLASPNNLINRLTIHEISRRPIGTPNIPTEIRKVAAILGNEGESCRSVGAGLGISKTSANEYSNGVVAGVVVPELKRVVDATKSEVNKNRNSAESQAVDILLTSLGVLSTEEGVIGSKRAKNISSVAKDMAAISNMMGNKNDPNGNGERAVHVHLYAPKRKSVDDYEVIDV